MHKEREKLMGVNLDHFSIFLKSIEVSRMFSLLLKGKKNYFGP